MLLKKKTLKVDWSEARRQIVEANLLKKRQLQLGEDLYDKGEKDDAFKVIKAAARKVANTFFSFFVNEIEINGYNKNE